MKRHHGAGRGAIYGSVESILEIESAVILFNRKVRKVSRGGPSVSLYPQSDRLGIKIIERRMTINVPAPGMRA